MRGLNSFLWFEQEAVMLQIHQVVKEKDLNSVLRCGDVWRDKNIFRNTIKTTLFYEGDT